MQIKLPLTPFCLHFTSVRFTGMGQQPFPSTTIPIFFFETGASMDWNSQKSVSASLVLVLKVVAI